MIKNYRKLKILPRNLFLQIAFLNITLMSMAKFVLSTVTRNAACQFPRNQIHHYILDSFSSKVVGMKTYLTLCKTFRPTFKSILDRGLLLKAVFIKINGKEFQQNYSYWKRTKIARLIARICCKLIYYTVTWVTL